MSIVLGIILIVVGIMVSSGSRRAEQPEVRNTSGILSKILIGIGVLLALSSTIKMVPPGQIAVVTTFGKTSPRPLESGVHIVNPFSDLVLLSSRTEQYTMVSRSDEGAIGGDDSVRTVSRDGLILPIDVTVNYRLEPSMAPTIYKNFGDMDAIVAKILRPAARAAVRDAAAGFSAQEAYSSKREQLGVAVGLLLDKFLANVARSESGKANSGVIVQQVLIRNIELPQKIKESIESKLAAEQDALRMEFTLQKERQEAERKRIEAKGISDFQAIVSQGLNDKLLQWKGIEATQELAKSENSKVIVIGSGKGGLPVILNPDGATGG